MCDKIIEHQAIKVCYVRRNKMNILSQILGIFAIITFAIAPHQKNKKRILIFQTIANILYALQYTLLYAFSAHSIFIIRICSLAR